MPAVVKTTKGQEGRSRPAVTSQRQTAGRWLGYEWLIRHNLPASAFAGPEHPQRTAAVDPEREDHTVVVDRAGGRWRRSLAAQVLSGLGLRHRPEEEFLLERMVRNR